MSHDPRVRAQIAQGGPAGPPEGQEPDPIERARQALAQAVPAALRALDEVAAGDDVHPAVRRAAERARRSAG